ncbi:hypothetical protein ACHAWF_012244 [Thalassiosira exigua]
MRKLEDPASRQTCITYIDEGGIRSKQRTYLRLVKPRARKEGAQSKSSTDLISRKANDVETAAVSVLKNGNFDDEFIDQVFRKVVQRRNLTAYKPSDIQLSIHEIIAIRNFCGFSSAKTLLFKYALEKTKPLLKNMIFISNTKDKMTQLEREGNLPVEVKKMPMITKKDGSKMELRIVWWLMEPSKMMERLLNMCIIDSHYEPSEEFSNLFDQIVVLWGIDKSAKDIGCGFRIANRRGGNSRLHTQLLGAVEDSSECHQNLKSSFFSKDCPLNHFLQALVYDHYQMLIVSVEGQCQSFTFLPCPTMQACTTRRISANLVGDVDASQAALLHSLPSNGLPPEVHFPASIDSLEVRLISSSNSDGKQIIGFQLERRVELTSTVVYAQNFSHPILLPAGTDIQTVHTSIRQVNGHVANDYKQLLILAGICSASALCSCVCCIQEKSKFNQPSERLQRRRMDPTKPETMTIVPDAKKRDGRYSVIETSKNYAEQTGHGTFNLPDDWARQINVSCGSTFHEYCVDIPSQKQNGGILHESGGIINHMYQAIRSALRDIESNSGWIQSARQILEKDLLSISRMFKVTKGEESRYRQLYNENKALQQKARTARLKVATMRAQQAQQAQQNALYPSHDDTAESSEITAAEAAAKDAFDNALANAENIAKQTLNDCKEHANTSHFAHLNLLKKGQLEEAERSSGGFEQTTGNGINTLVHFDKVADAVERVYPEGHPLHQLIKEKFIGFRRVAKLLYPFVTYMKSQKKRHVEEYMELLDPLLKEWDKAFPEKAYFLKLHHAMAHLPDFVEIYGMLGRVSEESFESVHTLMAKIKEMVSSMHSDTQRIETAAAKSQTTLKPKVMEASIKLSEKPTKKRDADAPKRKAVPRAATNTSVPIDVVTVLVGGEEFIDILGGRARLPKEWEHLYNLITSSRVPPSWRRIWDESSCICAVKKEEAAYANF